MHAPPLPTVPQNWSGRTRGGSRLFRLCASLLPRVGLPGAWLGSFLIGFGFLVVGGRRQFGMADYWRRRLPEASSLLILLRCWRQFASFGRILCDRLLVVLRPQNFRFSFGAGGTALRDQLAHRRGCILLSAHVGNWELTGVLVKSLIKETHPVYLVMVRDDLPQVQAYVDLHMRGPHITVVDPRDGLSASLTIARALEDGHPVCMLGDRVFANQPAMAVDFLSGQARFPLGPFQTAIITGVPIFSCFLVKTSLRSYHLVVDQPWCLPAAPRGPLRTRAVALAVQRWARRLEQEVRRRPLQWHNFYPFWLGLEQRMLLPRPPRRMPHER